MLGGSGLLDILIGEAAVAGIVTDCKRRRGSVDVIRMAIKNGQPLDPVPIEKLTSSEKRAERIDPLHVKLGGIITIASGIGICFIFFVSGASLRYAEHLRLSLQFWRVPE